MRESQTKNDLKFYATVVQMIIINKIKDIKQWGRMWEMNDLYSFLLTLQMQIATMDIKMKVSPKNEKQAHYVP